jgi:hypothetical protein
MRTARAAAASGSITCHFNLLSGSDFVNQIAEQRYVLVARKPTGWYSTRRLLQSDLLVVSVNRAFSIHLKPSFALALRATIRSELSFLVLSEWAKCRTARHAIKPTDFELRKHAAAARDDATDVDELVQVFIANIADLARLGALGQSLDANKNLLCYAFAEMWGHAGR